MIRRYVCTSCHFRKDYKSPVPTKCPDCGSASCRIQYNPKDNLETEFINITYPEHERWSESMGVPAHQVEQFRERYPNSIYDDKGRLLIKNRPDKLRQAKERGFIELK